MADTPGVTDLDDFFVTAEPAQGSRPGAPTSADFSLRHRVPAQAVMAALLAQQQSVPAPSGFARFLGRSPLSAETRPWYRGALGELATGRVLATLGPGWHVLHAVPVGKGDSDVDHVVIGPGGVFTLNTKNHSGQNVWVAGRTFMVAGQKQQHIRNAEHEARRAEKRLGSALGRPVAVTPLVVVVDPKRLTVREQPAEVVVLTARRLARWLGRRPAVLTAAEVREIMGVADRASTWHDRPSGPVDTAALRSSFDPLDQAVRRARVVRMAWPVAFFGVVVLAAVNVLPWLVSSSVVSHLVR